MLLKSIIFLIFFTQLDAASFCTKADKCPIGAEKEQPRPLARYDYTRIYHVEFETPQQVELFQRLEQKSDSVSFMGHARRPGQKLIIMVAAHKVADFEDILDSYKVKHRILNYNFQEKIDENYREVLPATTPAAQYDWQHYFHLETIYAWMQQLAEQHPHLVTVVTMGASTLGVPIKGVKLALHTNDTNQKTTVFIESGIHAREWITPATATYIIQQLISSNNTQEQELMRAHNWIIFPVVNPDGYQYTFTHDRMWRKNRAPFGICRGVDLNRNYPNHWNTTGASGDPCRFDYSGPAAASEVETQSLIAYMQQHLVSERIRTYIALHSYSQLIMFPYGSTSARVENYADLKAIGEKAAERIKSISGRVYKSGSIFETIYPSSGGSKDWAYGELKIPVTFTFELRGPYDNEDLFILPANEIEPTAREAFAAIQTIVEEAAARGYYTENNTLEH